MPEQSGEPLGTGDEKQQVPSVPSDRRTRVLRGLDPSVGRGLEIGPLFSPVVRKDEAQVCYVDVHLTPELLAAYADNHGLPFENFVEVDCALQQDGVIRSLAVATADRGPFDWVVASHVVEHVPDIISWLGDVADVLVDDGRLVVAVPDRRYCFDACRPETTVGEMLLAHHHRDVRPSLRAIFDHYMGAVSISASAAWRGDTRDAKPIHGLEYTRTQVRRSLEGGEYVDCHVWLFTPTSFVEQLRLLHEMGRHDFVIESVEATAVDDMEFYVTLRRLPRQISATDRDAQVAAGFPAVVEHGTVAEAEAEAEAEAGVAGAGSVEPLAPGTHRVVLSDRELRALVWKRVIGEAVRRVLPRAG